MKNKIKKVLVGILLVIILLVILGFIAFYVLIVSGLFPNIQELWVTTAMTTMKHQWCATLFIDDKTIEDIMKRTYVDDSGYKTNTELVKTSKKSIYPCGCLIYEYGEGFLELADKDYTEEGYEEIADGIHKKEVKGSGWYGYLMLVEDPSRVKLAQTENQFKRGETVMSMVKRNNAIAGINAGGFADGPNYDSYGEIPSGLLIVDKKVIFPRSNTNAEHSVIGFNEDNVLVLGKMSMSQAVDQKIRDCIDFRPFLIVDGEPVIKNGNGGWGIAPRTALGQRKTGEVIFLVIDGRQAGYSIGVDLRVLQDVLYEEGCVNAAMCDGGSSTVMVFDGKFVNKPSLGYERYINNAWIIK